MLNILIIFSFLDVNILYLFTPTLPHAVLRKQFFLPYSPKALLLSQVSNDEGNFIFSPEDTSNLIYWKNLTSELRVPSSSPILTSVI